MDITVTEIMELADMHAHAKIMDGTPAELLPRNMLQRKVEALMDRRGMQAQGKHPAPCARHCEATAFGIDLRRLQSENEQLRAGYDAARLEIASLHAQLEAVGAGGVEPLRPPSCWCESCDAAANHGQRSRMSLCPQCGNKRCPRAKNHTDACANAAQQGSTK